MGLFSKKVVDTKCYLDCYLTDAYGQESYAKLSKTCPQNPVSEVKVFNRKDDALTWLKTMCGSDVVVYDSTGKQPTRYTVRDISGDYFNIDAIPEPVNEPSATDTTSFDKDYGN